MRLLPFLACASLLAAATGSATAAERCANPGAGSVWIEGSWQQCGSQYSWRPGYWQTSTTTVCTTPAPAWVEGRWAQGANGWVWVEGHYEQAPTVCTTGPSYPPPQQVVYTQPQQVVYTPPPQVVYVERPQTTVVVSSGYGYGNGYGYGGYNNYGNNGYCRPICPPVTYCPPVQRPVCTSRPGVSVGVALPLPSIGFPTVSVGHHRFPVPIPVPVFRSHR